MNDNLQRLIALAKADGGKFFVIDEQGVPQLVIMGVAEYEQVLIKKAQQSTGRKEQVVEAPRVVVEEKKNNQNQVNPSVFGEADLRSEVIDSTFAFEDAGSTTDALDEI